MFIRSADYIRIELKRKLNDIIFLLNNFINKFLSTDFRYINIFFEIRLIYTCN